MVMGTRAPHPRFPRAQRDHQDGAQRGARGTDHRPVGARGTERELRPRPSRAPRPRSLPPLPGPHLPASPRWGWEARSRRRRALLRPEPSRSRHLLDGPAPGPSYTHPLPPGAHSRAVRRPAGPGNRSSRRPPLPPAEHPPPRPRSAPRLPGAGPRVSARARCGARAGLPGRRAVPPLLSPFQPRSPRFHAPLPLLPSPFAPSRLFRRKAPTEYLSPLESPSPLPAPRPCGGPCLSVSTCLFLCPCSAPRSLPVSPRPSLSLLNTSERFARQTYLAFLKSALFENQTEQL